MGVHSHSPWVLLRHFTDSVHLLGSWKLDILRWELECPPRITTDGMS